MPFNIGEVDKVSLDIKVEYIKNALYKDTVRFYMAGSLLYVLPGSLVFMIFQIVCWNKGWKVLTFLAAVILIYCLYEYRPRSRQCRKSTLSSQKNTLILKLLFIKKRSTINLKFSGESFRLCWDYCLFSFLFNSLLALSIYLY